MKNTLLMVLGFFLLPNAVYAENNNPPLLKKGQTLWYQCSIESADGEWAIQHFPTKFEMYIGEIVSKTEYQTSWKGHLAFTYRNGSVRLREANISQTSGFIDNNPKNGFTPYGWVAQEPNGDFEFRENRDSNTGWFKNFQLSINGSSGTYDCKIIEPIGLQH